MSVALVAVPWEVVDPRGGRTQEPPIPRELAVNAPIVPVSPGFCIRYLLRIAREGSRRASAKMFQHDQKGRIVRQHGIARRARADDVLEHDEALPSLDAFSWISFLLDPPLFAVSPVSRRDLHVSTAYFGEGVIGNCDGQVSVALSRDARSLEGLIPKLPHGFA